MKTSKKFFLDPHLKRRKLSIETTKNKLQKVVTLKMGDQMKIEDLREE